MRDYQDEKMPYSKSHLDLLADSWESLAEDYWKEDVFGV
jgi:hypothetical protein